MQIDRIYYPVETLGYGKRIGIWTIGCKHHCYNCSNPELWDQNNERDISIDQIIDCICKIDNAVGITITGGDPFEQPEELLELLQRIRQLGYSDILVYTGYTFEELQKRGEISNSILQNIGVLVDGMYIDELNDNKSFRGSSNQRILILDDSLKERYYDASEWERKTQILVNGDSIQAIGLPIK